MMSNSMKCGWMDWADIVPYREQLIEMEMDLMITYHYPDWNIPRSYVEKHVDALEQYIDSGNTFFWGVRDDKILYGYMWGYVSNFINIKRWNRRSTYFQNALRGKGFAMLGMEASLEKAKELGCNQMSTHYAVFNDRMKAFLEKSGFVETRVEMVKNI